MIGIFVTSSSLLSLSEEEEEDEDEDEDEEEADERALPMTTSELLDPEELESESLEVLSSLSSPFNCIATSFFSEPCTLRLRSQLSKMSTKRGAFAVALSFDWIFAFIIDLFSFCSTAKALLVLSKP